MVTPELIREARVRAGLSQAELASRLDRPQSTIARWEKGHRVPSLETTRDVVRACGLDLGFSLARHDDSYDALVDAQLALKPRDRLRRLAAPTEIDRVDEAIEQFASEGIDFVLIGPLAEALRGSPLRPPAPLAADLMVRNVGQVPPISDQLRLVESVPGAHGIDDLRRDATVTELGPNSTVRVASLRDLVRIAEASPDGRSRTPALRVALERSVT